MKYGTTLVALLLFLSAFGQDTTYNRFAMNAEFGLNNPIEPMAAQYDAATLNLFHVGLGFRYSFNTKFGMRLSGGYDNFRERSGTPDFTSDYYRVSLEGVANLGNMMDFQTWTRRIGLLFHVGGGYSVLNGDLMDADHIMHGIVGITPQVRLSERWNLYVDATTMVHVYQDFTYDQRETNPNRGVDGYLINMSLGLQYNFGPHARHADWAILPNATDEVMLLRDRVKRLEEQQRDDDGDGVVNYLDLEPGTPAGTMVDTKGRTLVKDSDSDNIPDDVDNCPFEKGTAANKGCPERQLGTGATEVEDLPGTGSGSSSAANASAIAMIEQSEVKFETDEADLSPSFKEMLGGVATFMKNNPSYKLNVTGHADDRASEEYNMALSQRRADAVRNYLIARGISGDRITTTAKGESQPKVNSTTVEARAENRRVQFDIR